MQVEYVTNKTVFISHIHYKQKSDKKDKGTGTAERRRCGLHWGNINKDIYKSKDDTYSSHIEGWYKRMVFTN